MIFQMSSLSLLFICLVYMQNSKECCSFSSMVGIENEEPAKRELDSVETPTLSRCRQLTWLVLC